MGVKTCMCSEFNYKPSSGQICKKNVIEKGIACELSVKRVGSLVCYFYCVFDTFPCGVLGQVCYLFV